MKIDVTFTPADFEALRRRPTLEATCVVFDVLRATSTLVTALAHEAREIIPVETIEEALQLKTAHPEFLLAGERHGHRILRSQTGSVDFDFGNSPREFMRPSIRGRSIVMTTTNGTRALRACEKARAILAASLLNLAATASHLRKNETAEVILVCGGTFEESAYEDTLGAGALIDRLLSTGNGELTDAAATAHALYEKHSANLKQGLLASKNGRRLDAHPELKEDVAFCSQIDAYSLVASMHQGSILKLS